MMAEFRGCTAVCILTSAAAGCNEALPIPLDAVLEIDLASTLRSPSRSCGESVRRAAHSAQLRAVGAREPWIAATVACGFDVGRTILSVWQYALWGAFGGLAVEAVQFYGALRRAGGWPWKVPGELPLAPLALSVVIRVGLGLGLAAAAGSSGQVAGALGAIAVGVAAPLLIEQMAKQLPLPERSVPATDADAPS